MSICRFLTWVLLPLMAISCLAQPRNQKPQIIYDLEEPVLTRFLKTYTESKGFFLAGTLCFISASISSAGGIGGGGLYIPILIIVVGLDLKTASCFSAFMITGASVANVACSLFDTNPGPGKKCLIDFDITLLSEPCMLLGVSIGVICNLVFPEWLITSMFALFLAWSTYKTFRIGVVYWRKESGEKRRNGDPNTECLLQRDPNTDHKSEGNGDSELPALVSYENSSSKSVPWGKLGELVIIWMCFSLVYLLRGNKYGQSIIQIKPCGVAYWVLSSLQVPLAITITAWVMYSQKSKSDQNFSQQEMEAPNKDMLSRSHVFPTMAMLAGTIGGVFGIGGGTLISPLLLQIGIPPEVTGATCSLIVFFSSTMSAFQYLLLGMKNMKTAATFAVICFLGSLIGLVAVKRAIKKHGRASLIIFSVGTVMALSTVLLSGLGVMNVWRDYTVGKYMGFNLPC